LSPLSSAEFRDVIGCFATGVTVITTACDGRPCGTTASAISSVSVEPPTVLICMNRASSTGQAVERTGLFAINILGEGHGAVAARFATKDSDKFSGVPVVEGACGQPLLADAIAHLVCRVTSSMAAATHLVFLAEIEAGAAAEGTPLAYFRGCFGRLVFDADDRPTPSR
jgi:flavin reductase (DIM6/NTAB) family NADH-FMN oxidoreductase RutF